MYHLLIVDDQTDLADDLAINLPWHDVGIEQVYKAYSAKDALDIIAAHPVNIVLTDIRMPGMSGLELIAVINESWHNIKCILLSGYSDFEYAKTAIKHDAVDYLLKPADDDELLQAVHMAVQQLNKQWNEVTSRQKTMQTLRANQPILRSHLLVDILQGHTMSTDKLEEQLSFLEVPMSVNKPSSLIFVRLEDSFAENYDTDISLLEYAVCNIAEEILGSHFHLWNCKDPHGYLVMIVQHKGQLHDSAITTHIEQKALQFQQYVRKFLKGTISLLISNPGDFPQDIHDMYESSLINFRQHIGNEREFLLTLSDQIASKEANTLSQLYDAPLLLHLLEAGQWDALQHKIDGIFNELADKWGDSFEHILETYFVIASSLSYAIHKNKQWMSDIMADDFNKLTSGANFHTIQQLRHWTDKVIAKYKDNIDFERQDSRSRIIKQVQDYVAANLDTATLQSISSHVYLNPSYLSKLYKMETGIGISDYIYQLKMAHADHLLRTTSDKIYEISAQLGYIKTSYFIKVFKEKFGVTPQEYREGITIE